MSWDYGRYKKTAPIATDKGIKARSARGAFAENWWAERWIKALEQITARLGIAEADVIAVGDGANDLGMLLRAGTGVALHAKPSVAAQCQVRINHGDLTALLYIQGIARADFAA